MVEPLPKWIMRAYSKLWVKFRNKEFTYNSAYKLLDKRKTTSLILSELKKSGWIKIRINPTDSRKRIYKLIKPEEAVKAISRG